LSVDTQQLNLSARACLFGNRAEPGRKLAAGFECFAIYLGRNCRCRGEPTHAQDRGDRVSRLVFFYLCLQPSFDVGDLRIEPFEVIPHLTQ
jgi:hypothetical protein